MKKTIKIEQLKPGMMFSSSVYIDDKNLFLRAFESLKNSDIEKLLKWGIDRVYTDGDIVIQPSEDVDLKKEKESKNLQEIEDLKLHKEYSKLKSFREEFHKRCYEIGMKLKANFKNLIEKSQFNNAELLMESLYLANQILEYRFFLLLLFGVRFSDDIIIHHSIHSACYGGYLGKLIGLNKIRIQELIFSMMIMDIGMYFIPLELRKKNHPLNEEEKRTFYLHTLYGYRILTKNAYVKQNLALVALQHHENFDGTGYPKRIKEQEIFLMARIASVVDRYTAMLEDRYHRKARIPYEAIKILLSEEAIHFDPRILKFFVGGMSAYPIGSYVELSNGYKALVIEGNQQAPLRPLVKFVFDDKKNFIKDLQTLDLSKQPNITITKVLDPIQEKVQIQNII